MEATTATTATTPFYVSNIFPDQLPHTTNVPRLLKGITSAMGVRIYFDGWHPDCNTIRFGLLAVEVVPNFRGAQKQAERLGPNQLLVIHHQPSILWRIHDYCCKRGYWIIVE